jgi:hypothetical protein
LYPAGDKPDPGQTVTFQFNPKTIKVGHSVSPSQAGGVTATQQTESGTTPPNQKAGETAQALTREEEYNKSDMTMLTLSDITFDGANVLQNCGMLLGWTYLVTVNGKSAGLTPLTFIWGSFQLGANTKLGSKIPVQLLKANVTYERFYWSGRPIRATVALELKVNALDPLKQNPTSGGLANRHGHVVIGGETLPGIATAEYGHPGEWRRLAEANRLDDPLRVRAGSVLYLPNRADLAGQGPA